MTIKFICLGCGKELTSSKKSGDRQSYCGEKKCQRVRKAAWQRQKVVEDADYRSDQARCGYVCPIICTPQELLGENNDTQG